MRTPVAGAVVVRADAARPWARQARPEQPVVDPPQCGRLQLVPQCAVAQPRLGAEQLLDDGQRTSRVAVVEALADAVEALRLTVGQLDGLQAGSGVPVSAASSSSAGSGPDRGRGRSAPRRPARSDAERPGTAPGAAHQPDAQRAGPARSVNGPAPAPRRSADATDRPRSTRHAAAPDRAAPGSPHRAAPAARRQHRRPWPPPCASRVPPGPAPAGAGSRDAR